MSRLLLVIIALAVSNANASDERPNIVILLADDLGWNCVGYHNREFATPHLDRLVRDGVQLDRFYVAPMCSPTRAGLLTGRYPIRFGLARAVIPPQRDFGLPLSETTLGEALADLGYAHRGVFGKWHLGHRRAKWHPLARGFTHFHGHYNGAIDYFELTRERVRDWHTGYAASPETGYATDLIASAAADWISEVAAGEAPYLCYVPFNAPHSPFQAPDDAIDKAAGDTPLGSLKKKERNRVVLKAMIARMDDGIGRILEAIDATGEADNTIVWFFSDNGGVGSLRDLNRPLRGSKLTAFEGGIRVPAAIRWPARLPAGTRCDTITGYIDILPTLLASAGGEPSSDQPLDGINLLPVLTDPSAEPPSETNRPWLTYHGQPGPKRETLSVIHDGWKLVYEGPHPQALDDLMQRHTTLALFHLADDPHERTDLADAHPDRVRELGRMLIDYRALQPKRSVPPYSVGKDGFVPPPDWALDPAHPNRLVGGYEPE